MKRALLMLMLGLSGVSCSVAPTDVPFLGHNGDGCCKHCRKGKACGDSCIAVEKQCHQPPGCACDD
jgi:hypothetical protein